MFAFIGTLVVVNALIAGGSTADVPLPEAHVLFTIPILGTPMSAESISLAVTLFLRYMAMATIGFPVAFCVAPNDFGIAFRRLGVPEKFAFGLDLTFRFLPSLAADFQTTVDAQRIRGFDWTAGASGLLGKVRRSGPVIVPTVVNAIAGAEDTIDAMDLRAFGTGHRTWLRKLRYDRDDLSGPRLLRDAAPDRDAHRLRPSVRDLDAAVPDRPRWSLSAAPRNSAAEGQ